MEYTHKIMRGTVGAIINKAIHDIRDDPQRSIRNLADMGDNFSTSQTQKHFFSLARSVLKNPCNPYNKLLVKLVENVNAESVRTLGQNFGYTALSYGAKIIRQKQDVIHSSIPWLLILDFTAEGDDPMDGGQVAALIRDAVSLGIYSFIFRLGASQRALAALLASCRSHPECVFFADIAPGLLFSDSAGEIIKLQNLILSLDAAGFAKEEDTVRAFRALHGARCFYGYHVFYDRNNADSLMSDAFTARMMGYGCIIGAYVGKDRADRELEEKVYRFACSKRGKKGDPLFTLDLYRDAEYVGRSISCGSIMHINGDGGVPGFAGSLKNSSLISLMQTQRGHEKN